MKARAKLLVGLGALVAAGLIVVTIIEAPRGLRERRVWDLLRDRSTIPNPTDIHAWRAARVVVARADGSGGGVVEDHWVGSGPLESGFKYPAWTGHFWDRTLVGANGRAIVPKRAVSEDHLVVFESAPSADYIYLQALEEPATSVAFVEGGRVYLHLSNRHGGLGVTPCGSEESVRARVRHVGELSRAFDEAKKAQRLDLIEGFLHADVSFAQRAAVGVFAGTGDAGISVLRRFLEEDHEGDVLSAALDALQAMKGRERRNAINSYLAREVTYWRRSAPSLAENWSRDRRRPLADHRAGTTRALEVLYRIGAQDCAIPVNEFRALYATFPRCKDARLESAVAAIGSMVDGEG